MNGDYLYINPDHISGKNWALVVLPEIYGLHDFIKSTTDRLAEQSGVLGIALDHLYTATGQARVYDYQTEAEAGADAMQKVTGEKFVQLLRQTLDQAQAKHPEIKQFVVLGFCFGGRLALLAGVDRRVAKIVSFYGGGPHQPFYQGQGAVEALAKARRDDNSLHILALYGGQDSLIPAEDRDKTEQLLKAASIDYRAVVYPEAGHAFANDEREHYNQPAAEAAWREVSDYLK